MINPGPNWCCIFPGSMGAAALAIDLFGADRVHPGSWNTPVYVVDVTDDEFQVAKELLAEKGLKFVRRG